MLFVKVLAEQGKRKRRSRQRGFAVYALGTTKNVLGESTPELSLSREQAQELWRWLGESLHGITIRVNDGDE